MAELPVETRFQNIEKIIQSHSFLNREGIGNEVPFFIFSYEPALEGAVDQEASQLSIRLKKIGVNTLDVNLYDLVVEIIKEYDCWEELLEEEANIEKSVFLTQVQNLTDVESDIIPSISKKLSEAGDTQLLILTGVGMIYPFIRTHVILNNLQKIAKNFPTLLFFPGSYSYTEGRGQSLDLFGVLNEDKYYRASNIEHYQP